MSDVQLLFLVVVLLYVWECACWVGGETLVFRTWWGRRWRIAHPGSLLGNSRGGFAFAPLLPPLGTVFTATELPLALSPEVLAAAAVSVKPRRQSEPGETSFRWADVREIETRGKKILVNDELLWKTSSPFLAWEVTQMLRELCQATPAEREKLLAKTSHGRFDTSRIECQWREFQKHTSNLRLAANVLFCYLFIVAPAAILHFGFLRGWLPLLAGLLALTSTIAILFHRAHKKFYPSEVKPASGKRAHPTGVLLYANRPVHHFGVAKSPSDPSPIHLYGRKVSQEIF